LVPLLLIAATWFVAVEINKSKNQSSAEETVNNSQVLQTQKETRDVEYRTQIATSMCNILRLQDQIQIAVFNDCVTRNINFPLEIYEDVTEQKLGKVWNALADNEKALVVKDVAEWEVNTKSAYESAQQDKKLMQELNAMMEKSSCESEMLKKAEPWIAERCPNEYRIFENMSCRSEVISSDEYKALYGC
jgi:hypothetical protein